MGVQCDDSTMQYKTVIICFVRLPVPGQVKTRLAKGIGLQAACDFYAACAGYVLHACNSCPDSQLVVYHSTSDSTEAVRAWVSSLGLGGVEVAPQAPGDLGAKMEGALRAQLRCPGVTRALLVGSDIPGLTPWVLAGAAAALDVHEVVLGPSADGGYYLVGLTRPAPALFKDVPWSTDAVLARTLDHAQTAGLAPAPPATLPTLTDIDEVGDLRAWREGVGGGHLHQAWRQGEGAGEDASGEGAGEGGCGPRGSKLDGVENSSQCVSLHTVVPQGREAGPGAASDMAAVAGGAGMEGALEDWFGRMVCVADRVLGGGLG